MTSPTIKSIMAAYGGCKTLSDVIAFGHAMVTIPSPLVPSQFLPTTLVPVPTSFDENHFFVQLVKLRLPIDVFLKCRPEIATLQDLMDWLKKGPYSAQQRYILFEHALVRS
jgi:hypothetical protein